jgi:putative intracellular protease/amidase
MELFMTHLRVPSATGSGTRKPSVFRRLAHLALAIALGSVSLTAVLLGGAARASVHRSPPSAEGPIPAGRPSSDGPIVVAVVLGRSGTDDADALAPYEVFARSTKFSVYSVAATSAPATMNGGLHVVPTYTFADIASGAARKPDLVVVPAVNDPAGEQEAELRAWIVKQVHTGARILGICAGSRILAATGILDGRRATSHWSRIAPLQKSNPRVTWVEGQRYVDDGKITTSAGVSSGIPASLHLLQELAGKAEAAKITEAVRYPGWTIGGPTAIPIQHFSRGDAGVGLGAVLPWFQPTLGVGLTDGVGEIDTSALTEVYSYASAAHLIPVSTGSSITTAHGVVLLTTPAASFRQRASRLLLPGAHSDTEMTPALRTLAAHQGLPVTPLGQGNTPGFEAALTDLASNFSTAIGRSTAKMVEYPALLSGPNTAAPAVRAPLLLALAIVLAAAVGMTPTLIRVLHRRYRSRQRT